MGRQSIVLLRCQSWGFYSFRLFVFLLLVCIDILLKLPLIEKRKTSTLAWLRSYSSPPPTVHLILVGTPTTIWRYRFSRSPSCPPTCLTQKNASSHVWIRLPANPRPEFLKLLNLWERKIKHPVIKTVNTLCDSRCHNWRHTFQLPALNGRGLEDLTHLSRQRWEGSHRSHINFEQMGCHEGP